MPVRVPFCHPSSLKKCLYRSSAHFLIGLFVFLTLSCMSCLYILEINPLSVSLQLFSPILWLVFYFVYGFFCYTKAFKLNQTLFVYFYFHYSRSRSKKILLRFMSESVLPTFSSKSFIVSSLIFRSLIHFEFIFGMVLKSIFNFILKNTERFTNLCVILLQGPCLFLCVFLILIYVLMKRVHIMLLIN